MKTRRWNNRERTGNQRKRQNRRARRSMLNYMSAERWVEQTNARYEKVGVRPRVRSIHRLAKRARFGGPRMSWAEHASGDYWKGAQP